MTDFMSAGSPFGGAKNTLELDAEILDAVSVLNATELSASAWLAFSQT